MAVFNQNPAGQGSAAINTGNTNILASGTVISLRINTVFADPVQVRYQIQPGGSALNIQLGSISSGGQALPTTGQIWPSGFN